MHAKGNAAAAPAADHDDVGSVQSSSSSSAVEAEGQNDAPARARGRPPPRAENPRLVGMKRIQRGLLHELQVLNTDKAATK